MSLTVSELERHIQSIKCKYSSFTNRLALSLQYNTGNLQCLQNTAWLVKYYIGILERFRADGKICTSCDITGQWLVTHVCGYIDAPYTTYTCYYIYSNTAVQDFVNMSMDLTTTTYSTTKQDGTTSTGTYEIIDNVIYVTLGGLLSPITVTYSEDCLNMQLSYDNPANNQTVILYAERTSSYTSDNCEWAEYCVTEEDIENIIKDSYRRLGDKCNC